MHRRIRQLSFCRAANPANTPVNRSDNFPDKRNCDNLPQVIHSDSSNLSSLTSAPLWTFDKMDGFGNGPSQTVTDYQRPGTPNGTSNGTTTPRTPKRTGLALTEYTANPSPPSEAAQRRPQLNIPEAFLLPNGYPDVISKTTSFFFFCRIGL